ncbi:MULTISPECIES: DUF3606 domain-containing protein [Ramlibacter]|uniref:DUF3606 domain-containing protein n=1 Tax=Ramlibacter aquaticus TaxID=2780094 RepID=A0ABR9SEZ3_9BURK|nr:MULTISPECIES: DUF3606 domain-containing protein [Ramlibacter]MBE7940931.1 DUF3606 domain-containing protein [Ramlibacter aquaticus]
MEQPDMIPQSSLIDLTRQTDVAFWCRVFDLDMAELRDAVHHAGHEVAEVRRWLERHPPARH